MSSRGASPARVPVVVLAGGFGGARMSHGLVLASAARAAQGEPALDLSVIVNTGDDLALHGLAISPDLDTVMYTLAGLADDEHGWGVREETWSTAAMLERYGAQTWFRLGDRDLATHLRRTELLAAGNSLTEVTAELTTRLRVPARLLPMCDEPVRTELRTDDGWLEFQEYFVHRAQRDTVHEVRRVGIESARPTEPVLQAIAGAQLIVVAPSNPFVSVGTILAVPGMLAAMQEAPAPVVAISPVVGGRALRGPADRMLESLGGSASASGVVAHYRNAYPGLVDVFVLDRQDLAEAEALARDDHPDRVTVLDTVMPSDEDRQRLALELLAVAPPGKAYHRDLR